MSNTLREHDCNVTFRPWALAACLLVLPSFGLFADTATGRLASSFRVSPDGVATLTTPLEVPPGTAGMQPKLAMLYNHRGGDGLAGVGFTLAGLSAIEHCAASLEQDAFRCGINDDAHDRFCLDGERLVNIEAGDADSDACLDDDASDPYYTAGAVYHTEHESWRQVASVDQVDDVACGNGPCAFEVTDKRGWTWQYGAPDDSDDPYGSRVPTSDGSGTIRVWALNSVTDRNGNAMSFYYTQNPLAESSTSTDVTFPCSATAGGTGDPASSTYEPIATEAYYPCRIDYTSNQAASLDAQRHVLFAYQARPQGDTPSHYRAGSVVDLDARLGTVATYVDTDSSSGDGDLVTDYPLCYDDDTSCYSGTAPDRVTSSSRVGTLTRCGADGTCLPVTTLTYNSDAADFEVDLDNVATNDCANGASWADFDGDGRIDWICNLSEGVTVQLASDFTAEDALNLAPSSMSCDSGTIQWHDFNADGLDDWLCVTSTTINVYTSTGSDLEAIDSPIDITCSDSWLWTDFNADGLTDWICGDSSATYVLLSDGTTLSGGEVTLDDGDSDSAITCDDTIVWADFNGDQMADWLCTDSGTGGLWPLLSTGLGLADTTDYDEDDLNTAGGPALCPDNTTSQWVDFNGDLLADLICSGNTAGGTTVQVSLSTGLALADAIDTWTADLSSGCFTAGQLNWTDVNGDGMADLACSLDGGNVTVARSTGGDLVTLGTDMGQDMDCTDSGEVATWQDITGDGLSDWICTDTESVTAYSPAFGFPDLLESTLDGFDGSVAITYAPLSDTTVYSDADDGDSDDDSDSSPNVRRMLNGQANDAYPAQGAESALYVVSSYTLGDGRGHDYSYSYAYGSGLIDFRGRGWLGFGTVTVVDDQLGRQTVTNYSQSFPFEGKVAASELQCSGSQDPLCSGNATLKRTSLAYDCQGCTISASCGSSDNVEQGDGSYATAEPTFEPFPCVYQVLPVSRQVDNYTYGTYDFSLGKTYTYDTSDGETVLTDVTLPSGAIQSVGLGNLTQQLDLNTVSLSGQDDSDSDNVYTTIDYYSVTDDAWLLGFVTERTVSSDSSVTDILRQATIAYDYPSGDQPSGSCTPDGWSYGGTMSIICQQQLAQYQSWDDNACSASTTDSTWLETTTTYDPYGNPATVTDPANNPTTTTYETTFGTFPAQRTWANGLTASFTYEPSFGRLAGLTDVNGNEFSSDFDGFGRRSHNYGPNDGDSDATDPFTLATYSWVTDEDSDDTSTFYHQVARATDWNDASDVLWSRTYIDGLGRTYQSVNEGSDSSSNIVRQRSYQTPSLVATETQPFLCADTDCAGAIDDNQSCGTSDYPYLARGYDAYSRPSQLLVPYGSDSDFGCTTSQWSYPSSLTTVRQMAIGQPEETFRTSSYAYFDSVRRTVWSASPFDEAASSCDPTDPDSACCDADDADAENQCSVTAFAFDILARLSTATDPTETDTSYCYDSLDRKQAYIAEDAFSFSFTWDGSTPGQMIERVDGLGQSLSFDYDNLNRVTTKTVANASQTVTSQVTYTWDDTAFSANASTNTNANGHLATVGVVESGDETINYNAYQYDSYGRLVGGTVTFGAVLTPDGQARDYPFAGTRDPLGRPITHDFPDGSEVQSCYDDAGRIARVTLFAGAPSVACADDLNGAQLATASYPSYNALSQPLTLDYGNGVEADYTYDTRGQMSSHTLASGATMLLDNDLSWDQLSQVDAITDQLYANGDETTDNSQQFTLTNQRLTAAVSDNYGTVSYAYDVGGRLTEIAHSSGDTVYYAYDGDSDGLAVQCGLDQTPSTSGCPDSTDASVVYWGHYDGDGNLASATESDTGSGTDWAYTYDPENRLTQVVADTSDSGAKSASSTLTSQYHYDGRGRRVQKQDGWDNWTLYVAAGYEVTFTPGTDGTYNSQYSRYLQSAGGSLAALTADGDGTANDVAGDDGTDTVSPEGIPAIGTFYYHQDHLGSTSLVTASDGSEYSQAVYEPFGLASVSPDSSDTYRPKFNGKELEEDTALYYFGSRYYDPARGRFLTADTRLGGPNATVQDAWNRYSFALNNPVSHADPTGHSVESWFKHAAHDVKKWVKKNWKQILVGVALDALTPELAPEEDAALATEMALETTSESVGGGVGGAAERGTLDAGGDALESQPRPQCEGSFAAGTLIATEDGPLAIEEVRLGQKVWAKNQRDDRLQLRQVLQTLQRRARGTLSVTLLDQVESQREVLSLTDEHPIWVANAGWTEAAALRVGDLVDSGRGGWLTVEDMTIVEQPTTVYNFEVTGAHSYFAGTLQAWVHNTCYGIQTTGGIHGVTNVQPPANLATGWSGTLPDYLSHFGPSSGLGGIYNDETGEYVMLASGPDTNFVNGDDITPAPRNGVHPRARSVLRDLEGDSSMFDENHASRDVGFTIYEAGGSDQVSWSSGVNTTNFTTRTAPPEMQQAVSSALSVDGLTVGADLIQ